jgi:preprotein translocase subunit SecE
LFAATGNRQHRLNTVKKPEAKNKTVQGGKTPAGTVIGKIEPVKAAAGAAATEKTPKKPFNPVKFFSEVRQEGRKITWTSRKETWITTVMVMIMVVLACIFFFIVDAILGWGASWLSRIGQ